MNIVEKYYQIFIAMGYVCSYRRENIMTENRFLLINKSNIRDSIINNVIN